MEERTATRKVNYKSKTINKIKVFIFVQIEKESTNASSSGNNINEIKLPLEELDNQ